MKALLHDIRRGVRGAFCIALFALLGGQCLMPFAALGGPVIPDYGFKRANGKPGVIPGYAAPVCWALAVSDPNPSDTGAGPGHQYLVVDCNGPGSYSSRAEFYHRNDVTPFDDFQGRNSFVSSIAHANDSGHDGRRGSVLGPAVDIFTPYGRMTHEHCWILASGSSTGPYGEWQPRDARDGSATFDQYLVYPDSDPGADSPGVCHTTSAFSDWGCPAYNKNGSVYVATLNAGTTNEIIRGLTYGYLFTTPYNWGSGMFEVGPWQDPGYPTNLGTRVRLSSRFFMTSTQVAGLVPGVNDAFRSWYHDGQYLFYLTGGAGDSNAYLSAVEITNWSNGTWQQVDLSSGPELHQSFSFASGNADTSLVDASGLVFAADPASPAGPPLLYIANGRRRIFVLEAKAPPQTVLIVR
jgi:hypothetical protein